MENMVKCSNCNNMIDSTQEFCPYCGQPVQQKTNQNPQMNPDSAAEQQFSAEQVAPQWESHSGNPYEPYQAQSYQEQQYQGQPDQEQQYQGQPDQVQQYQEQPDQVQQYQEQPDQQQQYQGQPYQQQQYQGQPYQQQQYQGQPYQQQQYQGQPYPAQQAPVIPKQPNPLGLMFKSLFSKQSFDVFKVKQNYLSIFLLIGLSVFLVGLSFGIKAHMYSRSFGWFNYGYGGKGFVFSFFISIIFMALIEGVKLGYGILMQDKQLHTANKVQTALEVMSASSIVPLGLYFLAFVFSLFWSFGYNLLLQTGFIASIVYFLNGLKVRSGEKTDNMFLQLALITVAYTLFRLTIYLCV